MERSAAFSAAEARVKALEKKLSRYNKKRIWNGARHSLLLRRLSRHWKRSATGSLISGTGTVITGMEYPEEVVFLMVFTSKKEVG